MECSSKKKKFDFPNSVKQGCILSPILFSLLVQEITNEIHGRGGSYLVM